MKAFFALKNWKSKVKGCLAVLGCCTFFACTSNGSDTVIVPSAPASTISAEACTNTYGMNSVTDCRDGQTYRTVTIGTQTWMAQNLNYAVDSSWCYDNNADSCAKYGRLYQWAAAMGVDAGYNDKVFGDSVNHEGACPKGWHVPRSSEWVTLENFVGGEDIAGTVLKSTSGWIGWDDENGNGTDNYGFSALPAGVRVHVYHIQDEDNTDFEFLSDFTIFWNATGSASMELFSSREGARTWLMVMAGQYAKDNYYAFSVRCVKD
jgi:uncharacterized protein (TIGR02145 family)